VRKSIEGRSPNCNARHSRGGLPFSLSGAASESMQNSPPSEKIHGWGCLEMMACQACGHDNSNDAASCEACGRPLRDAARQVIAPRGVELRQATVVFCDLVGSARLPYELDAAALVEFYDRYYNLV